MNTNSATVQGESYVYGGILFQRVTGADLQNRSDHTSMGTCLFQGLLASAVLMFLVTVICALLIPNGLTFYALIVFSIVFCLSLVPGSVQAFVIGLSIKQAGHDLRWFTRALIGALVFALFDVALMLLFSSIPEVLKYPTTHLIIFGILSACGAICGLVTGSRLPGRLTYRMLDFLKAEARYYLID